VWPFRCLRLPAAGKPAVHLAGGRSVLQARAQTNRSEARVSAIQSRALCLWLCCVDDGGDQSCLEVVDVARDAYPRRHFGG
jgi:hypothetical protein